MATHDYRQGTGRFPYSDNDMRLGRFLNLTQNMGTPPPSRAPVMPHVPPSPNLPIPCANTVIDDSIIAEGNIGSDYLTTGNVYVRRQIKSFVDIAYFM